jgi:hypothetical protein
MTVPKWLTPIGLFLFSLFWFGLFISWSGFLDPDAFYHARAALEFWQHGPLMSFPPLDLTSLGSNYADLHFLFHAMSAPFVAWLGMMNGIRVVTVLTSALFVLVFWACLRWMQIRWPLFWSVTLFFSVGLDERILLGKASALALIWFVFGLSAVWKRRPWLVAIATAGFALSHGGWPFLAGSVVLLAFGEWLFDVVVKDVRPLQAIRLAPWREVLATFGGAVVGLALHPNRLTILSMAWTQVVTIGLGTPFQHVSLGMEWLPVDLGSMIAACTPLVIFAILATSGLLFARRTENDERSMRMIISSGIIFAAFFALTLKSRRNVEYLVPSFTLWVSALWMLIDAKFFRNLPGQFQGIFRYLAPTALVVCLAIALVKETATLWTTFHPAGHPDDEYALTMGDIAKIAHPGDRVFHTSWDEFPQLFAQNDQLKYISGMDPTFLYVASSTLSDAYRDATIVTTSTTSGTVFQLAHDVMGSRFVFVSTKNHLKFLSLIQKDPHFRQISNHTDSQAFELMP